MMKKFMLNLVLLVCFVKNMNKPDDCESADLAMGVLDEFVFKDDESLAFIKQSQTFSQSSTSSFSRRLTDSHEPLHSWTKKSAIFSIETLPKIYQISATNTRTFSVEKLPV